MKLIADWRSAWRFASVWAAGATALLATAYDYLPEVRGLLPDGWVKWAALSIVAARVIQQTVPWRGPERRRGDRTGDDDAGSDA